VAAGRRQGVAGEHRESSRETSDMVMGNDAHRKGVTDDEAARWREAAALGGGEGAPVVASGARGFLHHWGTTRSEEGRSIDDGELGRV
jgi:hypothetical protein